MIFSGWATKVYNFSLPMSYKIFGNSSRGTVVLLHGFQDHALSFMKRLQWMDQDLPFQVCAINGPFPVPTWTSEGLREAFAWYFRDSSRNLTLVAPEDCAKRVGELLTELQVSQTPTVLMGFSQGGYLAPHLGKHIPGLRGIIGIGCGYKQDAYKGLRHIPVHAIHGSNDQVIKVFHAATEHSEVLNEGFPGTFHGIEGLDHKVDARIEPLARGLIQELLA